LSVLQNPAEDLADCLIIVLFGLAFEVQKCR